MNLTPELYEEYRELSVRLGFELNDIAETPYETAVDQCNGIGPEWFPAVLRKAIDALHPSLVVVSVNHDLNWSRGDGSASYFLVTNAAFEVNGVKVAKDKYSWYDPRRWWVIRKARQFRRLLDDFGGVAYRKACPKNV